MINRNQTMRVPNGRCRPHGQRNALQAQQRVIRTFGKYNERQAQAVKALTRHKTAYIGESSVTVTGDNSTKSKAIKHQLKKRSRQKRTQHQTMIINLEIDGTGGGLAAPGKPTKEKR